MNNTIYICEPYGTVFAKEIDHLLTYDEIKKIIGCQYIERVPVRYNGKRSLMIIDEEGAHNDADINDEATKIYHKSIELMGGFIQTAGNIYGIAVILQEEQLA